LSEKSDGAFRTIGEAAESLDLPQHVLRFWETRFKEIEPIKRAGGRRYYRPRDMELLSAIRQLLYGQGYTIKGVQRILKEQGARAVIESARSGGREEAWPKPAADAVHAEEAPGRETPRVEISGDSIQVLSPAPPAQADALPRHAIDEETAAEPSPIASLDELGAAASLDADAMRRLRRALDEIAECRRLLKLTRR
jgi:DNA-binding transcriptional MerR regulator